MRLAFSRIAAVLLEAGILAHKHLEKEIPDLVWDSAIAGGWWRYASETPLSIFPEAIGHYWFGATKKAGIGQNYFEWKPRSIWPS